jgi:hypothetical protein
VDPKWARPWFAATAAAVAVGVAIQIGVSATTSSYFGGTALGRSLNVLSFFTIQSNLLVGAATVLLALDLNRPSAAFCVLRMIGLVGITVTFVVFHVVLSRLLDLDTWSEAANQLLHTVVPVLALTGWVAFGPRGLTSARVAKLSVLFPLLYMAFALIRGPLNSDWYPYPFADAKTLGYFRVLVNAAWIMLLFAALAAGATALDRRLRRTAAPEPAA